MTYRDAKKLKVTVILPALNEEKTIGEIVRRAKQYADQVIVVDDGSIDKTAEKARKRGATVISHGENKGYIASLRTGFKNAKGDIIVIMDADGQHKPEDIPSLIKPIIADEADLVVGARSKHSSPSERILTWLTRFRVKTRDACSGFRALRKEIAEKMRLKGKCTCGTFILEAYKLGARVKDVEVEVRPRIFGKSRMKKEHFIQFFLVLKEILI